MAKRKFLGRAVPLAVRKIEQGANILQREAEFPASADKCQPFYVVSFIYAVSALGAEWGREKPNMLVISNSLDIYAGLIAEFVKCRTPLEAGGARCRPVSHFCFWH